MQLSPSKHLSYTGTYPAFQPIWDTRTIYAGWVPGVLPADGNRLSSSSVIYHNGRDNEGDSRHTYRQRRQSELVHTSKVSSGGREFREGRNRPSMHLDSNCHTIYD